jgi:hypothetical protein
VAKRYRDEFLMNWNQVQKSLLRVRGLTLSQRFRPHGFPARGTR